MDFEKVWDTLLSNNWLSREEAKLLYVEASSCSGPILEVGSYPGRSTVLLAGVGRPVYVVDSFSGFSDLDGCRIEPVLPSNLKSCNLGGVQVFKVRMEGWKPRSVGFAYLGGDHGYEGTISQITAALACGPQVVAIHGVNDRGGGAEVKRAALNRLGSWDARIERLAVWKLK